MSVGLTGQNCDMQSVEESQSYPRHSRPVGHVLYQASLRARRALDRRECYSNSLLECSNYPSAVARLMIDANSSASWSSLLVAVTIDLNDCAAHRERI